MGATHKNVSLITPNGQSVIDDATDSVNVTIVGGAGSGGTSMTDDAAFVPGTGGITPAGGIYRSVRDAVDDNDAGALAMTQKRALLSCLETPAGDTAMDDTNDAVRVNIVAGGGAGGTSSNFGSAVPSAGTAAGFSDGTNMQLARVFDGDSGAGTQYIAGVGLRKIASGGTVEAGTLSDPLRTDPVGTTAQPVTDNGGSLTIDGTVTANLAAGTNNIGDVDIASALPAGDAVIGRVKLSDGTDVADILDLTNSNPLTVAVVDATGDQITSFGGGTQYTEGDVDATITGTAMLMEGATNTLLPVQGTVADGLLVNLGTNNDVTVTGSVTANAGTNLNTSALALESGGNLAGAATSLALLDDAVFAEDVPAQAADKGIAILAVRRDADTSLVGLDNDYANLQVNANGALKVEIFDGGDSHTIDGSVSLAAAIPAGDNVIGRVKLSDGTDVADILDLTNSNPLTVAVVDASGDQITSFGGGTQYTVNAVAPADPVGPTLVAERDDQLATLTEVEGDWTQVRATSKGALWVAIPDTNGDPITSFGGGTQYTEGDTDATITGTAMLWEDSADTLRVPSAAKPLPVEIIAGGGTGGTSAADDADFTATTTAGTPAMGVFESTPTNVTDGDLGIVGITTGRRLKTSATIDAALPAGSNSIGQVTANAGTNLNTSALALESGGNLAGAATSLALLDDTVFAEDVAAQAADKGIAILAVRRDADTSLVGTDNDYANLQVNANGALKVEIFDGGDSHTIDGTVTANAGTNLNTSLLALESGGNLASVAGCVGGTELQVDVVGALPAGTNAIGKLAANSGVDIGDVDVLSIIPGTGATNLGKAEDAAHTTGDVGVMALGVRAASPTERSAGPTDGDYEPFATNEVGAVWVSQTPSANGGLSIFRSIDLDETEEDVKTTAGTLYWYYIYNNAATTHFVKFYNATAATVVVGTTTPVLTLPVPAGAAANVSIEGGLKFDTAICVAATTAVADADTGAPAANAIVINLGYK